MATAKRAGAKTASDRKRAPREGEGRPSKYDEAFADQARKLCLLGATNDELADFFDVATSTISKWLVEIPEFSEAVKGGRVQADANVADRLYSRALGYSHPEVHVSNYQGAITLTPLTKHYPPDTAAAFIWLKNRQGAKWKDKQEVEITGDFAAMLAERRKRSIAR